MGSGKEPPLWQSGHLTKVYWIRHAEAEGNLYRRCHGQYDSLVTENGKAQLAALERRFDGVEIDAVYTSDLYRARRTADALAQPRGLAAIKHKGLREIDLGPWEDLPWLEVAQRYPEEYDIFTHKMWEFDIAGAEPVTAVAERGMKTLAEIAARHRGQTVAIVSHGVLTRSVMTLVSGYRLDQINVMPHGDNTSVSYFEIANGKFDVQSYADNSHLGELSTIAKQNWWREGNARDAELAFDPVDLPRENDLVDGFRRNAWWAVYQSEEGYHADKTVAEVKRCARQHPRAAVVVRNVNTPVGFLLLDTLQKADEGYGHISLLTLDPAYRGKGLGVQLIGYAVSVYRALGRKALHLRVADTNERAIRFYRKLGFTQTGVEEAEYRPLVVMVMGI